MTDWPPLALLALSAVGVVAGWVNTLAGGGSILTVPMLMYFGLPADIANGTSRVAIVAQGVSSVATYRRAGMLTGLPLAQAVTPTLFGAFAGSYAATLVPEAIFRPILLGTLLLMGATLFLKQETFMPEAGTPPLPIAGRTLNYVALFGAGLYGGFLQAGVGIILIAVFGGLLRYDLVRANAIKVVAVFAFGTLSAAVFLARGRVVWIPGLALAVGNALGAYLGVRFAIRSGQNAVRGVLFVVVVVMCGVLLLKR